MNVDGVKFMDELLDDELTLGEAVHTIRVTEYSKLKQIEFAELLGMSKSYLCDLEHNRKAVSVAKAVDIAKKLKQSKRFFITLAVQDILRKNSLDYKVQLA